MPSSPGPSNFPTNRTSLHSVSWNLPLSLQSIVGSGHDIWTWNPLVLPTEPIKTYIPDMLLRVLLTVSSPHAKREEVGCPQALALETYAACGVRSIAFLVVVNVTLSKLVITPTSSLDL